MQQGIFEKSITVTPDYCDAAAQLSPLAAFTIFQGIAAQHAELIGVGGAAMAKRGEFWLTVHTRVDFLQRAGLMDELTAATWPEPCDGKAVRCYRSYSLRRGDALLALGRTQWAVLGPEKKLMQFAQTGFPADFPFSDRTGITDHPTRFADDLTQAELVRGYTVRPTDIDFGRHMNNVAYVRVLLDCFSLPSWPRAASRRWRSTTPLPVWRARNWASTAAVRRAAAASPSKRRTERPPCSPR